MLVLGDAHADEPSKAAALERAYRDADADVALQVGDLLTYDPPVETYFIAGNNEDFDVIEALRRGEAPPPDTPVGDVHLIASEVVEVEGLRVAGLSGNFAPTQFEKTRDELAGDRRRHFVAADVEAATALEDVDVFLLHEAPHGLVEERGYDVGCTHVDDILRTVEPRLCLVGHHHTATECRFGTTRVVSLGPAWEQYYTLDPETLWLTSHETPGPPADR
jgi:Icc-related predicted phosphoesterase